MDIPDCRQFSRSFMKEFIDMYKSFPCLWKMKSKDYTNRHLKKQAYCHLIRKCQEVDKTADKDFVVRKINSLRTTFRKTLNKVMESRKDGASPYQPSLWYFHMMMFVVEDEEPTFNVSCLLDESQESEMFKPKDELEDPIDPQFLVVSEFQPGTDKLLEPPKSNKRRRKVNDFADNNIIENVTTTKPTLHEEMNDMYVFGKVISSRLNNMQTDQRIIAEKLISDIIYHGQLNNLTYRTSIQMEDK